MTIYMYIYIYAYIAYLELKKMAAGGLLPMPTAPMPEICRSEHPLHAAWV